MKHLLFRSLIVSISLFMICACHDVKQEQKIAEQVSQTDKQNDNCINESSGTTLPLGSIAAQSCPVNTN